jgi:PhoPQ-activated pathogenicity-related protein
MRSLNVILLLVSSVLLLWAVQADPIDNYANLPDPVFNWTLTTTLKYDTYKLYNLYFTSQQWLNASDSSVPIWTHWLQVCIPDVIESNVGLLYIDGGSDGSIDNPPKDATFNLVPQICQLTGSVVADLGEVPNQPISFPSDPLHMSRTEDEIIAYTWAYYMNNTKEPNITNWVLEFPMAKAGSMALTAMQEFVKQERDHALPSFVVGGASKRGWATWLTAVIDRRVIAIVPIVAPFGNVTATLNEMWKSYGEWTFAFQPYCQEDIPGNLNHPVWFDLMSLIDVVAFKDRLTLPKYLICATGDEFFLPQSPLFFWDDLMGPKYLRMVPNAEHSMAGHAEGVMVSVVAFMESIIKTQVPPEVEWSISEDGTSITYTTNVKPEKVKVWSAHNPEKRDFREIVCGIKDDPLCLNFYALFSDTDIEPVSVDNGIYTYVGTVDVPSQGWTAYLVEAEYPRGDTSKVAGMKITSAVSIIPQTFPYEGCGLNCTNYCPP